MSDTSRCRGRGGRSWRLHVAQDLAIGERLVRGDGQQPEALSQPTPAKRRVRGFGPEGDAADFVAGGKPGGGRATELVVQLAGGLHDGNRQEFVGSALSAGNEDPLVRPVNDDLDFAECSNAEGAEDRY